MIAQLLHRCGLYLGPENQLLGATSANTDGHFEHKGFLKINRALLKYFDASWEFPPAWPDGWQSGLALEPLRADARALVAELSGQAPWGWKEPRTTVLLPFWKSIVPGLRFVICVRSPLEVAKSLATRNGIPVERGMFLWHRYTRAALEDSEDAPRLIVHYEDFFIDPDSNIDRLARFCGLQKPPNNGVGEFAVRPELRHERSAIGEILSSKAIPVEHKVLYLGLRALSRQESSGGAAADAARPVGELLRLLEELRDQNRCAQLQTELAGAKNEIARVRAEMLKKANRAWRQRIYRSWIKRFGKR